MVDFIDRQRGSEFPREERFIYQRFIREETPEKLSKENYINLDFKNKLELKNNFTKNIKDYPLRNINPALLEREDTDRRVDGFIQDFFRRQRHGDELAYGLPVLREEPRETERDIRKGFSSSTGLRILTREHMIGETVYSVNGQVVVGGTDKFTEIHFTPEGRISFNPKKMTDSLAKGITGIVELLDAIDKGKVDAADYVAGTTNINMALIAQRLGFVITDDCRTEDGKINKNLVAFKIVGKLADIRSRVEEFQRSGSQEKLMRRSQRLRLKPTPS